MLGSKKKIMAVLVAVGALAGAGWAVWPSHAEAPSAAAVSEWVTPSASPASPTPSPSKVDFSVKPASKNLPVIDYTHVPSGFPTDADSSSTAALTKGLHPTENLALYDAAGGDAIAYLPPSISGVSVTVPILDQHDGWIAVMVPSANRKVGWIPAEDKYTTTTFDDQLLVTVSEHKLTWFHSGVQKESWTVATGAAKTPTPLGRTFVLGQTITEGVVYAGVDAIVLGAVPDDKNALSEALKNGHTAIHAWYRPSAFGHSVSNGCVRIPKAAEIELLAAIPSGTPVSVIE